MIASPGKIIAHGSSAGATRPHEEVSVGDALAGDRILQRAHHMVLPDNVVERLGPPLAGNDLVGGGRHWPQLERETPKAKIKFGK